MSPPRATRGKRKAGISRPLPLPVNFTLLPSLLPTRALTPVLYSCVVSYLARQVVTERLADAQNGLPIYLTVLPTHSPHLSFLPLLISLFPTSPLHLIKLFPPHETANSYSHDLQGNAPFVDIWVPLPRARELCRQLGIDRLFWDDKRPEVGLLSQRVGDAISWEEENAICHK